MSVYRDDEQQALAVRNEKLAQLLGYVNIKYDKAETELAKAIFEIARIKKTKFKWFQAKLFVIITLSGFLGFLIGVNW